MLANTSLPGSDAYKERRALDARLSAETAIRAVVNKWLGPVQLVDQAARMRELAERDGLLQALFRLVAIGRAVTKTLSPQKIRAADVERAITWFRRLALMWNVTPADVATYCETHACDDGNVLAHTADPLQLRYLCTFHRSVPGAGMTAADLGNIERACEAGDQRAMRTWFDEMGAKKDLLPKGTTQALRGLVLRLWNAGVGDVETLAYEMAVLDVRMFDAMGWETSRTFCALLKRIGGGRSAAFGAYLTDEDVDEALALHEEIGEPEQVAYFRALLTVYDTKLVSDLERAVLASAKYADVVVQPDPEVVIQSSELLPQKKSSGSSKIMKFFGLSRSAAA